MIDTIEKFIEEIRKQYRIYGYEKQHYLKEILEEFTGEKFKIFNEEQ